MRPRRSPAPDSCSTAAVLAPQAQPGTHTQVWHHCIAQTHSKLSLPMLDLKLEIFPSRPAVCFHRQPSRGFPSLLANGWPVALSIPVLPGGQRSLPVSCGGWTRAEGGGRAASHPPRPAAPQPSARSYGRTTVIQCTTFPQSLLKRD